MEKVALETLTSHPLSLAISKIKGHEKSFSGLFGLGKHIWAWGHSP
jgi:hypothetical protein